MAACEHTYSGLLLSTVTLLVIRVALNIFPPAFFFFFSIKANVDLLSIQNTVNRIWVPEKRMN